MLPPVSRSPNRPLANICRGRVIWHTISLRLNGYQQSSSGCALCESGVSGQPTQTSPHRYMKTCMLSSDESLCVVAERLKITLSFLQIWLVAIYAVTLVSWVTRLWKFLMACLVPTSNGQVVDIPHPSPLRQLFFCHLSRVLVESTPILTLCHQGDASTKRFNTLEHSCHRRL